jgi:hypothetical protein
VKEMDLSQTHGVWTLREDCVLGKHQVIETDISWIMY